MKQDGFSDGQIVPVYVQPGEQGSYQGVQAAGFAVIQRCELIALLQSYLEEGGADSIARDFHAYLRSCFKTSFEEALVSAQGGAERKTKSIKFCFPEKTKIADFLVFDFKNTRMVFLKQVLKGIENRVEAFRSRPIAEWDWYAWQGFYAELQRLLGDGEWGYVANPSGGFLGFWWHWYSDAESEQYLQIEQCKLCFKISVSDVAKRSELRAKWLARILEAGRNVNFPIVKPPKLGLGGTMTVAVFKGEFRSVNDEGTLDVASMLGVLRAAANVLDQAIR